MPPTVSELSPLPHLSFRDSAQHCYAFLRRWILLLLGGAYVLGGSVPSWGRAVHAVNVDLSIGGATHRFCGQGALLAVLLFCAGYQLDWKAGALRRRHLLLAAALFVGNLALPLAVAAGASLVGSVSLTTALVVVAVVPTAASSIAWTQASGGSLLLSLALVLGSTILSPLSSPLVFAVGRRLGVPDVSGGSALLPMFFLLSVLIPTFLGLAARRVTGQTLAANVGTALKLVSLGALLFLNYVNAALALPDVLATGDLSTVTLFAAVATLLCTITFFGGWAMGKLAAVDRETRASAVFALGMNNNGAGLVLASSVLAAPKPVILFLLVYNLVQQIFAAAFCRWLSRVPEAPGLRPRCP